jgi:hypothetical protein
MARRWRLVSGLLLLVPVALLAGCAGVGNGRGAVADEPYITDVPASFYDNDPALRQWFTAPYWMPDASP